MMPEFTITGSDLHAAAAWASRAIPNRPIAPVLSGLLLDAGDHLTVSGYDYDTAVTATAPATTTRPGRTLLSGRLLAEIAKTVRGDRTVTITCTDATATAREGRAEWTMPTLPVDDYPALPDLGDPAGHVDAGMLRHAVAQVTGAAGRDDTLPMLTGVKLEATPDHITLAATDRFRLATTTIPWAGTTSLGVLAPAALLDLAVRAFRNDTDKVNIHHSPAGLGFATDTHRIVGRLLDAQFPRWQQLLPATVTRYALLDRGELVDAITKASVAAGRAQQIVLAFTADTVEVSAAGDDNKARADAQLVELVGDPITVAVNADYLRAALDGADGERVRIALGDAPRKPIMVTPDGAGDGYRHLVMPVNLPGERAA